MLEKALSIMNSPYSWCRIALDKVLTCLEAMCPWVWGHSGIEDQCQDRGLPVGIHKADHVSLYGILLRKGSLSLF